MHLTMDSADHLAHADIEIYNGYGDWDGLHVERLTHECWQVVCSPQAILKHGPCDGCRAVTQLAKSFCDWLPRNLAAVVSSTRSQAHPHFGLSRIDTTTVALRAIKQSDFALLTRSFVAAEPLRHGELVLAHPATMSTSGGHYMGWRKGDQRPKVLAFCDWIRREIAKQQHA
uniref:LysR substrate-binding domain-containing protein n=1 Tax=Vibrio cholerae TaxID=666 RepID=UPI003F58D838